MGTSLGITVFPTPEPSALKTRQVKSTGSHWLFLSELGKVYGPSIEQASGGEQLLPFVWAAVVNWGKTIAPLSLHGAKNASGCS